MEVFNPRNICELAECLTNINPGAVVAGGCTDVSVRFLAQPKPNQLLNVTLVEELREIYIRDGFLRIGAAATLTDIEKFPLPEEFTAFKQAVSGVGSKQIRNAATIGGNVMNASPAADLLPCLFMFGARVEYMKPDGPICESAIEEIVVGAEKTSLAYNEVLNAIKIPLPEIGLRTAFLKLGFRKKVTVARINIAISVSESDGKIDGIRFFLGAVAPVPYRVPEVEKILLENRWGPKTCEKLTQYLSDMLERTVPLEFDRDYKKFAVKGAVYDILTMFPYWAN